MASIEEQLQRREDTLNPPTTEELLERREQELEAIRAQAEFDAQSDAYKEAYRFTMEDEGLGIGAPGPDRLDALNEGIVNALTFGFKDEMYGGLTAPFAYGYNQLFGDGNQTFGDSYRNQRDFVRGQDAAIRGEHPNVYLGGEIGGLVATIPRTVAGGLVQGIAKGTGTGVAYGLGTSDAELTGDNPDYMGAIIDAGTGGLIGGAAPVVMRGAAGLLGGVPWGRIGNAAIDTASQLREIPTRLGNVGISISNTGRGLLNQLQNLGTATANRTRSLLRPISQPFIDRLDRQAADIGRSRSILQNGANAERTRGRTASEQARSEAEEIALDLAEELQRDAYVAHDIWETEANQLLGRVSQANIEEAAKRLPSYRAMEEAMERAVTAFERVAIVGDEAFNNTMAPYAGRAATMAIESANLGRRAQTLGNRASSIEEVFAPQPPRPPITPTPLNPLPRPLNGVGEQTLTPSLASISRLVGRGIGYPQELIGKGMERVVGTSVDNVLNSFPMINRLIGAIPEDGWLARMYRGGGGSGGLIGRAATAAGTEAIAPGMGAAPLAAEAGSHVTSSVSRFLSTLLKNPERNLGEIANEIGRLPRGIERRAFLREVRSLVDQLQRMRYKAPPGENIALTKVPSIAAGLQGLDKAIVNAGSVVPRGLLAGALTSEDLQQQVDPYTERALDWSIQELNKLLDEYMPAQTNSRQQDFVNPKGLTAAMTGGVNQKASSSKKK